MLGSSCALIWPGGWWVRKEVDFRKLWNQDWLSTQIQEIFFDLLPFFTSFLFYSFQGPWPTHFSPGFPAYHPFLFFFSAHFFKTLSSAFQGQLCVALPNNPLRWDASQWQCHFYRSLFKVENNSVFKGMTLTAHFLVREHTEGPLQHTIISCILTPSSKCCVLCPAGWIMQLAF